MLRRALPRLRETLAKKNSANDLERVRRRIVVDRVVDRIEFLAFAQFGDTAIEFVQNDEAGLIIDRAPVDGTDKSNELTRLYAIDGRKRPKQFGERACVRPTKDGVALLAVPRAPPTQETSIVGELFVFLGLAALQ